MGYHTPLCSLSLADTTMASLRPLLGAVGEGSSCEVNPVAVDGVVRHAARVAAEDAHGRPLVVDLTTS